MRSQRAPTPKVYLPRTLPRAAGGLVLCLCVNTTLAHETVDAARGLVKQKLELVARLLADPGIRQRVASSDQPQAQVHLDEGRLHHAAAEDQLAKGDLSGARKAADDALRHLAAARRLAPDAPARMAAQRARYEQMFASTERLIEAWRQRLEQARGDRSLTVSAAGLLGTARSDADAGRYDEAQRTLAQAESLVLQGMARALPDATLDYTARFVGAAEEFEHELGRHRALAELVPLAIQNLKPAPEARALVARWQEGAGAQHERALQLHRTGDTVRALEQIREASLQMQRALTAAGLVMPGATGTPP
jgi:hypothetical protein